MRSVVMFQPESPADAADAGETASAPSAGVEVFLRQVEG